jgi:spore coat polysaccharide biosynthesis protein SpsF (cytidylyltransferase family)
MGSTRLPGKVLATVEGQPLLWHVLTRLRRARRLDNVVVATSTAVADDRVEAFCRDQQVALFRGSEGDVLDRYYQAALEYRAENVVRITADCPLIDPDVVDQVIGEFFHSGCDYAANIIRRTFPHGLDTEVFKYAALAQAAREAKAPAEREHVTPYLRDSGRFSLHNVVADVALAPGYYRWTVDEASDLEFVRAVYRCLGTTQCFDWRTVVELLDAHPELSELNAMIVNDAGHIGGSTGKRRIPSGLLSGVGNVRR